MERLPQELVAKIAGYLPDRHQGKRIRPALATLSRSWQHAVEPHIFESIHVTSDDFEDFRQAFSSHKPRRRLLRNLRLNIILPQYSDEDCAKYETAEDRAANNHVFSQHVSALLRELSQWPSSVKLNLAIDMYSPMDVTYRGFHKLDRDQDEVTLGIRQDIFGQRYNYSYIRFDAAAPVLVPCVTSFGVHPASRTMDPVSLVSLTAAFPKLERINWPIDDPAYFLALRRQLMKEFASAVSSFQPPSTCRTLYIHIYTPLYPHGERLPNLTSGDSSICDTLRVMLGRSKIQFLDYEGPIDPSLFWPEGFPERDHTSTWKSLRAVEVRFELGSLAGQWLFKGLPGDRFYDQSSDIPLPDSVAGLLPPGYYGSDEKNAEAIERAKSMQTFDAGFAAEGSDFRYLPRDEAILPLLMAIARRLAHTPSLRKVYLETMLPSDKGVWFFLYHAPGNTSNWDKYVECEGSGYASPLSRPRVFLHAGDWRPEGGVLAMLRWIGKACHGEDAIVTFLPIDSYKIVHYTQAV